MHKTRAQLCTYPGNCLMAYAGNTYLQYRTT
jgi:hypothetical protein